MARSLKGIVTNLVEILFGDRSEHVLFFSGFEKHSAKPSRPNVLPTHSGVFVAKDALSMHLDYGSEFE